MIIEIGHFCMILTFLSALIATFLPYGQLPLNITLKVIQRATYLQTLLLAVSFLTLLYAFYTSDFSVLLTFKHSHIKQPLLYKIGALIGNHEGSFLLWILLVSFLGSLFASLHLSLKNSEPLFYIRMLSSQALLVAAFCGFGLLASNPFLRVEIGSAGLGLNPILQDPSLVFHPPSLYLGFVGFSVPFTWALAVLTTKRISPTIASLLHPWALLAWGFLTLGITLGSFWAYYELGWGGWWFWDPVETVSLLPWVAGIALIHLSAHLTKHPFLKFTLFLSLLPFSLCLIGTLLIRSGFLISVHSFALDPDKGVLMISIWSLILGGAFGIFLKNKAKISWKKPTPLFFPSKETLLLSGSILFLLFLATLMIGTFAPLLYEVTQKSKISIGAPYFNHLIFPFSCFAALLMLLGIKAPWRRFPLKECLSLLLISGLIGGVFTLGFYHLGNLNFILSFTLALSLTLLFFNFSLKKIASSLSHIGFALLLGSIGLETALKREESAFLKVGESLKLAAYTFHLQEIQTHSETNFEEIKAHIEVFKDGDSLALLTPSRRFYIAPHKELSETSFQLTLLRSIYVVLGPQQEDGSWYIKGALHPFVGFIWLGGLLMACASLMKAFLLLRQKR